MEGSTEATPQAQTLNSAPTQMPSPSSPASSTHTSPAPREPTHEPAAAPAAPSQPQPSSSSPPPSKKPAGAPSSTSSSPSSAGKKKKSQQQQKAGGGKARGALFAAFPILALSAATLFMLRKTLKRGKSGGQQKRSKKQRQQDEADAAAEQEALAMPEAPSEPADPDTLEVMAAELQLAPPPTPPAPLAAPPLSNLSFMTSESMPIQGTPTTHGTPAWAPYTSEPASATAPLVARTVAAGATCVGKASMQAFGPRGPDMAGTNYGNPHNKTRVSGGSQTGAAVAVALGHASFTLAPDMLGETRVPAACCRVYAYRPTPGLLSAGLPPSAGSNSGLEPVSQADSICVVTPEHGPLPGASMALKVAEALGVPGSSDIRGEILKFVVAQDLFDMCAPEFQPATLALKKAILKWAGSDQAGAVQLVRFLSSNVQGWEGLVPPHTQDKEIEGGAEGAEGVRLADFLEALLAAAQTLQRAEMHRTLGAFDAAASAAAAATSTTPQQQQQQQQQAVATTGSAEGTAEHPQAPTPSEPAAADKAGDSEDTTGTEGSSGPLTSAPPPPPSQPQAPTWLPPMPSQSQLAAAQQLSRQVFECLRATVKPDTVMVLPALPFPPPKRGALQIELDVFAKLTTCFNALAFLGNCPTLTVPVGSLRDGSPVAITLLAVHKFDLRLLAVAKRLCPMIHDAFEGVKEEITQMAIKQAQAEAAAKAGVKLPEEGASANGPMLSKQQQQQKELEASIDPKKLDKAEKAKNKGNEFYQAGRHADAINEYTKAIALNPTSNVYYSNRAIACIKLFRFEQAEEDCKRALSFDLSQKDKVKALLRRATARDALQKYDAAEADLKAVLALEANNKQAREDLQALRQHRSEMASAQTAMAAQFNAQKQQAAIAAAAGAKSGGSTGAAEAQKQAAAQQQAQEAGMSSSLIPPELLNGV